jgi:hypothetical protein
MDNTKLNTVFLNEEENKTYYYTVYDPYDDTDKVIIRKDDYESIEAIECKGLMNSIILKCRLYDFIDEDIEHYYYKCNKGMCNDDIVLYIDKDIHNYTYHYNKNNCCIII